MQLKKYSTHYRVKARMQEGRLYFVVLLVVIYGADKRNIALMLFVSSVIPILWVQMEMVEVVLRMLWP